MIKTFSKKWIVLIVVLAAAAATALLSAAMRADNAVDVLQSSIRCEGGEVSFTIPEGHRTWNLLISGRQEVEGFGGMSVHYLEGTAWEAGASYSFDVSGGAFDELTMSVSADGRESIIDLLPCLPAEMRAGQ